MPTLKDAMYGLAVGDALGVPYEFKGRASFHATGMTGGGAHGKPPGTWSDDTSLALATCASIKECGHVDVKDMRDHFMQWASLGKYAIDSDVFDIGIATSQALYSGKGRSDERSNGNGSLMRILPLAFTDATDAQVRKASAITHAHKVSTEACCIYVDYARRLIAGDSPLSALGTIKASEVFGRLATIDALDREDVRSSGYVVDTLEAALWCLTTTGNYKDCVLEAVNLGNDTDTVAAVTGGLAGIVYGFDAIPKGWIKTLRGKEIIAACLF